MKKLMVNLPLVLFFAFISVLNDETRVGFVVGRFHRICSELLCSEEQSAGTIIAAGCHLRRSTNWEYMNCRHL